MASSVNANKVDAQQGSTSAPGSESPQHQAKGPSNFDPLDETTSNTLKRNPKMELNKTDVLKLLSHLEGELQARDVVIATLKSEKLKQLMKARQRGGMTQAQAALQEDSLAMADPNLSLDSSLAADLKKMSEALDNVVCQSTSSQVRMARLHRDMEIRHRRVVQELDEEKRKHEHDTAQGDDITYGLEKERTRLKQELEMEKQAYRKVEKELKRANESLEEERARQKQIVLLLLAERKKLVMKYVEERKRSEDLAQIVSEEKLQMNAMADGLEEESKKSLQMEAELEKQVAQFDAERQQLKACVAREQGRVAELEAELERAHKEVAMCQASVAVTRPPPRLHQEAAEVSSVAKVVQPTATVSSVPVSAPTTGIARAVFPPAAATPDEALTPTRPGPTPGKVFGKSPFHAAAAAAAAAGAGTVAPAEGATPAVVPPPKKHPLGRGTPPPVPPNKPVVPPKKDASAPGGAPSGAQSGASTSAPGSAAKMGLLAKEKAPQPQVGSEAPTPAPTAAPTAAAAAPSAATPTAAPACSVDSLHASTTPAREPATALLSARPSGAPDVTAITPSTPEPTCTSPSTSNPAPAPTSAGVPSNSCRAPPPGTDSGSGPRPQHHVAPVSSATAAAGTAVLPEQQELCSHSQFEQTEMCMLPKVDAV